MLYWVIYDIGSNKSRTKVSNACKNYGLIRAQKSVFIGGLTKNRAEMLAMTVKEILGDSKDAVFLLPQCESCFASKIIEGKLDEESVRKKDYLFLG